MKHLFFIFALATALTAQAAEEKGQLSPETPPAASSTAQLPVLAPAVTPKVGIYSWSDTVRASETSDRNYKNKNEIFAGAKLRSGWSLIGMIVQYRDQFDNTKKNNWHYGDPSVRVGHPAIALGNGWNYDGQLRYYIPATDRSQKYAIKQFAYSTNITGHVGQLEVWNNLIPRYFYEANYHADHTVAYAEDRTQVGKKFNKWLRGGLGQYTQVESHKGTPLGVTTEVYPYADVLVSKQVFLGPRFSLPVVARNSVYDAPKGVSLKNSFAELFLSASL